MSTPAQDTQTATGELPLLTDKEHVENMNMSKILGDILKVLKGSTIAEEGGDGDRSKFWATYKKVSEEYDDDFLDRATDDMTIILTFAGLFSAVNSTFIVGTQPNPGDVTNVLMVQLIQVIANGPDAVDIGNLSTSLTYPPSTVWMQTLFYASLAFSVLAAFGAVMGKQWINSYKTTRSHGTLEERGLERQKKQEELENWYLPTILGTLLVLLQISLLLFGLSLSANMFGEEIAIFGVIVGTTAFGMIFYVATLLVAVFRPYSPFQSPGSKMFRFIFREFLPIRSTSVDDSWRAIRWILETSTNPDVVSAAAAMIPQVHWPNHLDVDIDVGTMCKRLCDTFTACSDKLECVKGIAHFWARSMGTNRDDMASRINSRACSFLIHDAFTAGHNSWKQYVAIKEKAQSMQMPDKEDISQMERHMTNAGTALKTMLVYGGQKELQLLTWQFWKLSGVPDYENLDLDLIWNFDLEWRQSDGQPPCCKEFDWLINYLVEVEEEDSGTTGDALLALSSMRGLGSPDRRNSYIKALIRLMKSNSLGVRNAALKVVADAREDLASTTSDLTDALSCAFLTAVRDPPFYENRDYQYLRLVLALAAKKDQWHHQLSEHGHVDHCIFLADSILQSSSARSGYYLVGILLRIDPEGTNPSLNPRCEMWPKLMSKAWDGLEYLDVRETNGCIDLLPAFIQATRQIFLDLVNGLPTLEQGDVKYFVTFVLSGLIHLKLIISAADESPIRDISPALESLFDDLKKLLSSGLFPDASRYPVNLRLLELCNLGRELERYDSRLSD